MRIYLIGAGNVAHSLGASFKKAGHEITGVFSRTEKNAEELAKELTVPFTTTIQEVDSTSDVYLLAVKDEVIGELASELLFEPRLICHTSGSIDIGVFPSTFKNTGVFYPLQTISKNKSTAVDIPICIEGSNPEAEKKIFALATSISDNVNIINSEQRKHLHLAAVFANNFPNFLFTISEELLAEQSLSFDLLKPLIKESAEKATTYSPSTIQTGPAKRGDSTVIAEHLSMLEKNPAYRDIYSLMSKSILARYGTKL